MPPAKHGFSFSQLRARTVRAYFYLWNSCIHFPLKHTWSYGCIEIEPCCTGSFMLTKKHATRQEQLPTCYSYDAQMISNKTWTASRKARLAVIICYLRPICGTSFVLASTCCGRIMSHWEVLDNLHRRNCSQIPFRCFAIPMRTSMQKHRGLHLHLAICCPLLVLSL